MPELKGFRFDGELRRHVESHMELGNADLHGERAKVKAIESVTAFKVDALQFMRRQAMQFQKVDAWWKYERNVGRRAQGRPS